MRCPRKFSTNDLVIGLMRLCRVMENIQNSNENLTLV